MLKKKRKYIILFVVALGLLLAGEWRNRNNETLRVSSVTNDVEAPHLDHLNARSGIGHRQTQNFDQKPNSHTLEEVVTGDKHGIGSQSKWVVDRDTGKSGSPKCDKKIPMKYRPALLRERCELAKVHHPEYLTDYPVKAERRNRYSMRNFKAIKLLFCAVPKSGTRFFDFLLKRVISKELKMGTYPTVQQNFTDYTKFIFVREPFSRLLSGYLSKYFSIYYKGKGLVKKYRGFPMCDARFSEFIKNVLYQMETHGETDVHWQPHSAKCTPCKLKFNFIGKLETMTCDSEILVDEKRFPMYEHKTIKEVYGVYSKIGVHEACMRAYGIDPNCTSIGQALERLWVIYQMRGVMSHKVPFPYTEFEQNKYPDSASFQEMFERTIAQNPPTSEDKAAIRQIVLRHAYSTIDPDDIDRIRKLYFMDFYLYGYDLHPGFLTDKGPLTYQGWEPFKLRYKPFRIVVTKKRKHV